MEQTIAALHELNIGRIGAAHCTGPQVAARLVREFGERFFCKCKFASVGTAVEA